MYQVSLLPSIAEESGSVDDSDTMNFKNPLLIDLVLKNVFAHLPEKDLLMCRSVCKAWKCMSVQCLRKREDFILILEDVKSADSFMKVFRRGNTEDFPYGKVELHVLNAVVVELAIKYGSKLLEVTLNNIHSERDVDSVVELFRLFLSKIPNVRHLQLSGHPPAFAKTRLFSTAQSKQTEQVILTDLTQLSILHHSTPILDMLSTTAGENFGNPTIYDEPFVKNLVGMAPNIQSIKLVMPFRSVYQRILNLTLNVGYKNLKELELCGSLGLTMLKEFVEMDIRLSKLCIFKLDLDELMDEMLTELSNLINKHKDILTELAVPCVPGRFIRNELITLPKMIKLETLLVGFEPQKQISQPQLQLEAPLSVIPYSYFPRLNTMKLEALFSNLLVKSFSASASLKTLEVRQVASGSLSSCIDDLRRRFPNLTTLIIDYMVASELRSIFEFETLVHLTINRLKNDNPETSMDSLMTGVSPSLVKEFIEEKGNVETSFEQGGKFLNVVAENKSISALKNLKTLKICLPVSTATHVIYFANWGLGEEEDAMNAALDELPTVQSNNMNDASIYFGFLKMQKLEKLELEGVTFSEDYTRQLKDYHENVDLVWTIVPERVDYPIQLPQVDWSDSDNNSDSDSDEDFHLH